MNDSSSDPNNSKNKSSTPYHNDIPYDANGNDNEDNIENNIENNNDTANNWYAKLHPIGVNTNATPQIKKRKRKRRIILNLSLFFRIWIAVSIIIIISGIVVFNQLFNYVRPITQQVIEDTLVDTSKLLAASLQSAVESGEIYNEDYQSMMDKAFYPTILPEVDAELSNNQAQVESNSKDLEEIEALISSSIVSDSETAPTWYHKKTLSSFRLYVTDAKGVVIYDSLPKGNLTDSSETFESFSNAEGVDYSKWNDINLTLHGKYGARTTRTNPEDPATSIMYVAQPIYASSPNVNLNNSPFNDEKRKLRDSDSFNNSTHTPEIIGVVSVGKPTVTILPYLNATRKRMLTTSFIICIITLIMAGLIAWWLRQSTLLVTRYTQSLAQDTKKPYFYLGRELNELSDTIESMKHRLENRAYVTDYVHTLTHELKSPLTAIRASGELLEEADLDCEDRLMLSQTITEQSIKLQSLIDRLLLLAKIEQPTFKLTLQNIDPDVLIKTLIKGCELQLQYQQLQIEYSCQLAEDKPLTIMADEFWITQALQNVLDNALYFAHTKVLVHLSTETFKKKEFVRISIINDGELIPEYALQKVFDRYFSLSHQYPNHNNNNNNNYPIDQNNTPVNSINQKQGKKGTGLGLTLVKQVIERHGGNVGIRNIETRDNINASHTTMTGVEVIIFIPTTSIAS